MILPSEIEEQFVETRVVGELRVEGGDEEAPLPREHPVAVDLGEHLDLIDISVRRNAFGRQVSSFETDLVLEGDPAPLRAVFIRAPWVAEHGHDVEVLGQVDGHPVAVRQGPLVAVSFHPELAGETRLHELLLGMNGGPGRAGPEAV